MKCGETTRKELSEEKHRQMIACVPDSSSKVEKVYDLHAAYKWVRIRCVHGQNVNVKSFRILTENEQLENFVSPIMVNFIFLAPFVRFLYIVTKCWYSLTWFFLGD